MGKKNGNYTFGYFSGQSIGGPFAKNPIDGSHRRHIFS